MSEQTYKTTNNDYRPGVAGLTFLVVNCIITGIYSVWNLSAFVGFGGFVILFFVVSFMYFSLIASLAEIASSVPIAGGAYGLARFSLGFYPGFLVAGFECMEYIIAVATCVDTLGLQLAEIFHDYDEHTIAFATISVSYSAAYFIYALFPGKPYFIINSLIAIACIILLLVYFFGSFPFLDWEANATNASPFFGKGSWETFLAIPPVIYVYFGIEVIQMFEITASPRHTVPKAFYTTFSIMFCLALLVIPINWAIAPGQAELGDALSPLVYGYELMFPKVKHEAILWLTIPTFVGSSFALMFTYEEVIYSMANSRLIPAVFAKKNRAGARWTAQAMGAAVSCCLCFVCAIDKW